MSDKFVQTLSGFTSGTGTVTVVLPGVGAGSALCAFAMDGTGGNNVTVSDGQGSYTQGVATGPDTNVCYLQPAYLENANAGSHSVVVDTHSGAASAFLTITEVQSSGVGAVQGTNSASQSLSAGADLIQSGTVTFSTPCTVVGFATDTGNVGALNVPAVGTSPLAFSQRDSNFNVAIGSWLLETVAGSATAGATAGAQTGSNFQSGVIVVQNPSVPTINTQPADQTVPVGAAASFSVSATASTGSLTYQWQEQAAPGGGADFVNIAGATSATLTFVPTGAQNGYRYRCVVTDGGGSTNTNGATLRVLVNAPSPSVSFAAPWLPRPTFEARLWAPLQDVRGWLPGPVPLQIQKWFSDWLEAPGAVSGATTVNCSVGNLVLGGVSARIILPLNIRATVGNLTLGSVNARVQLATAVNTVRGNLVLGGVSARVQVAITVAATKAQLQLGGVRAGVNTIVGATVGRLTLGSVNASVILTTVVRGTVGNLLLGGVPAAVILTTKINASVGNLLLGGVQAAVIRPTPVNAGKGNLVLGGVTAAVIRPTPINATVGNLQLNGVPAAVIPNGSTPTVISCSVGGLTLGGVAAAVKLTINVNATRGNLTLGSVAARVQTATAINAGQGNLTLGHVNARVQLATAVNTTPANLLLGGVAATVRATEATQINCRVGSLALGGVPAQVTSVIPPPPVAPQPVGGGGGPGTVPRRKRVRVGLVDTVAEVVYVVARSTPIITPLATQIAALVEAVNDGMRVVQRAHWTPRRARVALDDDVGDDLAVLSKSDDPQQRELLDYLMEID